MNMFVALFLLNASFLSNESVANTEDNAACVFIALLLHYSMLASFTWFFIQALHMYLWLIRQNVTITNYMRKITVLGWGELEQQNPIKKIKLAWGLGSDVCLESLKIVYAGFHRDTFIVNRLALFTKVYSFDTLSLLWNSETKLASFQL